MNNLDNPTTISNVRHQDYKQSKVIHSSRSFLNSLAIELARIYRIPYRECRKHADYITIGDIFHHAYTINPLPIAGEKQVNLNDYYTADELDALELMNDIVYPNLHTKLTEGYVEGTKELVLPVSIDQYGPLYQTIALKTKLVAKKVSLITKSEGSVSGGNPITSGKDATPAQQKDTM